MDKEKMCEAAPVLFGCVLFGCYLLTIYYTTQGFLWRYLFPIYPAFLLSLMHYFQDIRFEDPAFEKRILPSMVPFALLWTLLYMPLTMDFKVSRRIDDRLAAGQALAGLEGRMFVSESGTLPYFSGWQSKDLYGLTSEEIAHHGLTYEMLDSFQPDLIMLYEFKPWQKEYATTYRYMAERGFLTIAAIEKRPGAYNFYYARKDSPLFDEVLGRLLHIPHVKYGTLDKMIHDRRIPLLTRS